MKLEGDYYNFEGERIYSLDEVVTIIIDFISIDENKKIEYFMKDNENGKKVPMILERHYPKELADLEYTQEKTKYAGAEFRTSTPESVYSKKMYTKHPKDILDIKALEGKIDKSKIAQMKKYQTTLKIVEPDELEQNLDGDER